MTARSKTKQNKHTRSKTSRVPKERFAPGTEVPRSGVYEAFHAAHRITHQVTLIVGQEFPLCSRCKDRVRFELVQADDSISESTSPVIHVIGVFVPEAA